MGRRKQGRVACGSSARGLDRPGPLADSPCSVSPPSGTLQRLVKWPHHRLLQLPRELRPCTISAALAHVLIQVVPPIARRLWRSERSDLATGRRHRQRGHLRRSRRHGVDVRAHRQVRRRPRADHQLGLLGWRKPGRDFADGQCDPPSTSHHADAFDPPRPSAATTGRPASNAPSSTLQAGSPELATSTPSGTCGTCRAWSAARPTRPSRACGESRSTPSWPHPTTLPPSTTIRCSLGLMASSFLMCVTRSPRSHIVRQRADDGEPCTDVRVSLLDWPVPQEHRRSHDRALGKYVPSRPSPCQKP